MDYNENLPIEQEQEIDTLEFALKLVSWIPNTLKSLMHSDDNDNVDFLYFAIGISMVILAIRGKNDRAKK